MKKLLPLLLLTGLLACQEPGLQPAPPPEPTPHPTASGSPVTKPDEPSQTPEPQMTASPQEIILPVPEPEVLPDALPAAEPLPDPDEPVQQVTILDITPEAFKGSESGEIQAMTLDKKSVNPRLFVNYREITDYPTLSGLWQFQTGKPLQAILSPEALKEHPFGPFKYANGALYALGRCPRRYLLSDLEHQRLQPESLACLPDNKSVSTLYIASEQEIFSFGERTATAHPIRSSAYHISRHQADQQTELFNSQPVGINQIVHLFMVHTEDIPCLGLCFPLHALSAGNSDGAIWNDLENNISYPLHGIFRQTYTRPFYNDNQNFTDDLESERLPFIVDGPSDRATFWQPKGLQQDRQGNFYLIDQVAQDYLLRQITPEGQVRTLVSSNGLTDFGYPAFQHSLKSVLSQEQQLQRQAEYIFGFVIDRPRDWLYILGLNLYRLDLRSQKLELLAQRKYELDKIIDSQQAEYLDIDAAGHLYLPGRKRIYKILIPQPEGRR